jgi:hypothetical protein
MAFPSRQDQQRIPARIARIRVDTPLQQAFNRGKVVGFYRTKHFVKRLSKTGARGRKKANNKNQPQLPEHDHWVGR